MRQPLVVIVTGASSGIGAATAGRLAREGHLVVGTSRSGARGEAPSGVEIYPLDVDEDASVSAFVEGVLAREGRIDVLVNNAGSMLFGPIEEISLPEARALFETNFWGVARLVSAVLGAMRAAGRGHIVNVGSIAGRVAIPMNGFYAATKHALAGYTEALRHEVEHLGVSVTLVEPGDVKTGLWREGSVAPSRIAAYEGLRARVLERLCDLRSHAEGPESVATTIAAVIAGHAGSAGRVTSGKQARMVARMRAWMPAAMFEQGTRRRFGIQGLERYAGD